MRRRLRSSLALLSIALLFLSSSCSSVEFWQKRALSDPTMEFEKDGTAEHFEQKVFQATEGAAGGLGASAGGGCGCY